MVEIIIPISFFALVLGIVYLAIRKKERMALIERGMDASFFMPKKSDNPTLKWGLVMVMLGIGLIIANILIRTGVMEDELAYFSMLFLCGGIALLTYYIMARAQMKAESKEDKEEDL